MFKQRLLQNHAGLGTSYLQAFKNSMRQIASTVPEYNMFATEFVLELQNFVSVWLILYYNTKSELVL